MIFLLQSYCCVLVMLLEISFETKVWTANKFLFRIMQGVYKPIATKKSYLTQFIHFKLINIQKNLLGLIKIILLRAEIL